MLPLCRLQRAERQVRRDCPGVFRKSRSAAVFISVWILTLDSVAQNICQYSPTATFKVLCVYFIIISMCHGWVSCFLILPFSLVSNFTCCCCFIICSSLISFQSCCPPFSCLFSPCVPWFQCQFILCLVSQCCSVCSLVSWISPAPFQIRLLVWPASPGFVLNLSDYLNAFVRSHLQLYTSHAPVLPLNLKKLPSLVFPVFFSCWNINCDVERLKRLLMFTK